MESIDLDRTYKICETEFKKSLVKVSVNTEKKTSRDS